MLLLLLLPLMLLGIFGLLRHVLTGLGQHCEESVAAVAVAAVAVAAVAVAVLMTYVSSEGTST